MESLTFITIALFVLGFGAISQRLQKTVITGPMIFTLFGILMSANLLGLIHLEVEDPLIHTLAELTLVLILFTDASRINLSLLRQQHTIPVRLLSIGMPLTILLGTATAAILFDYLSFWEGAVIAAILAPTDAALGQVVVSSKQIPTRIRQALNVESGLNDGIAVPVILLFLSLARIAQETQTVSYWVTFTAQQVIFGPLVGIAVGYLGGKLVEKSTRAEWMDHSFQQLASLGLALLAFALAEVVGGNGFIAAFCAGLTVGNTAKTVCHCLYEFAEAEGQFLSLLTFMVFGGVMLLPALGHFTWQIALYGFLSLTIIRLLPVALSLIGTGLKPQTILFLGWFGPRGIASLLFALLVLEEGTIAGRENIFTIVIIVVLMSIFAHGLSALPGVKWYHKFMTVMTDESKEPMEPMEAELMPVTEMQIRHPHHP